MFQNETIHYEDDSLCILLKIKDMPCAIHSSCVESLFLLEQDVTPTPEGSDVRLGIIPYRGGILPLLDLRPMMGMETRDQEQAAFEQMLDQRKQDHMRWVDELKRCLHSGESFRLATDPHQCAFGKWYYGFRAKNPSVAFHLKKLEEPHAQLHRSALCSLDCLGEADPLRREEAIRKSLAMGAELYVPQVLSLLEDTKQVFRDSARKMVVVLRLGQDCCGILVDEVCSVETLHMVKRFDGSDALGGSRLVVGAAQRQGDEELVLLLNGEKILETTPQPLPA